MNYHCGGYFVVKQFDTSTITKIRNFPDRAFSVSACITDLYPDELLLWYSVYYPLDSYTQKSGLNEAQYYLFQNWLHKKEKEQRIGWPGVCFDLETAFEIYHRFLSKREDVAVLGIGLSDEHIHSFLDFHKSGSVYDLLRQKKKLDFNGEPLGFDILGYEDDSSPAFHCFMCNGLVEDLVALGIEFNSHGLISSLEQAKKAADYVTEWEQEELQEPSLYLPWLVLKYS